jgi:hypothetical protein
MIHNKQEGGRDGSGVYSVAESDKLGVAFVYLFPSPNRSSISSSSTQHGTIDPPSV